MAEKRKAPAESSQRRRAPTIDLTATEVPNAAQAAAASSAPAPGAEAASAAAPADAARANEPAPETIAGSEPPPEQPAAAAEERPPDSSAARAPLLTAVVLVAIAIAGVLAALWYAGVLPGRGTQQAGRPSGLAPLERQVAALRSETDNLKSRVDALAKAPAPPPAPSVDPKTVEALSQRVAKLENELNKPAAAPNAAPAADLTKRLAAAEAAVKANGDALAALKDRVATVQTASAEQTTQRIDQLGKSVADLQARVQQIAQQSAPVSAEQFKALQERAASLGQRMEAAQKQVAQNAAAAAAVRFALSATTLHNAVLSHAPYESELKEVKAVGGDAKALAPLQRFAASGVPSDAQLAAELRRILPTIVQAEHSNTAPGGFLDRLRADAAQLVRVAPANAPSGDAPADALTRLSLDAEHADIGAALSEIGKLPPGMQAKLADWTAKARAQADAIAAARSLTARAARALGGERE